MFPVPQYCLCSPVPLKIWPLFPCSPEINTIFPCSPIPLGGPHYLSVLAYSQGSKVHTYHTVIIVHIIDICVHKCVRTQFECIFFSKNSICHWMKLIAVQDFIILCTLGNLTFVLVVRCFFSQRFSKYSLKKTIRVKRVWVQIRPNDSEFNCTAQCKSAQCLFINLNNGHFLTNTAIFNTTYTTLI